MASSGQKREQTPQPRQAFSSRRATSSALRTMASVGHHSTQVPQPLQVSSFYQQSTIQVNAGYNEK
jgi:hypothetical protein